MTDLDGPGPLHSTDLAMTAEEIDGFLAHHRYAAVATTRRDGSPFVTPLSYVADEGRRLWVSIGAGRSFISRVRRDPRVCVSVSEDGLPSRGIVLAGTARKVDDTDDAIARRILWRSLDYANISDKVAFEEAFLAGEGRVVFELDLHVVTSWDHSKRVDQVAQARVVASAHRSTVEDADWRSAR